MAIWKEQTSVKKDSSPLSLTPDPEVQPQTSADLPPANEPVRRSPSATPERKNAESVISAGLSIEGTITGNGDVRIAGQFKGDVNVQGSLTIEAGAKLVGGVRASNVVIDGELEGNIEGATRVELRSTGVLNGNLNTGSLTVAAGSRMRGQVEFGWAKDGPQRSDATAGRSIA
ncbi:MAG TPA: polymer-forming cytoskeletal protein [Gemmatimonadaceae bacterium]|jgi:cytoskeletal protein CcmA (bactofilin family)|nr:polymer-forming cytoskeletal protein [Gemmatimonadaceae bacterium]